MNHAPWGGGAVRSAFVAALVLLLSLTGCASAPASDPDPDPAPVAVPTGVVDDAFQVGDGPVVVTVVTDAECPHCRLFDAAAAASLDERVESGDITLRIVPVNYVSAKHGDETAFSRRAMNLLALLADAGQTDTVPAAYSAILALQPEDPTAPRPTNQDLLAAAESAGAVVDDDIRTGLDEGRFDAWVQQVNDRVVGQEVGDTGVVQQYVPLVIVADTQLEILEDGTDQARLQALIDEVSRR